ncbi:hypothetical protein BKA57DRAFT_509102 [Linnemannia elongata]|nr:hypothetical protein BKA57DRAFT_509102 [Linnemannia elongata]
MDNIKGQHQWTTSRDNTNGQHQGTTSMDNIKGQHRWTTSRDNIKGQHQWTTSRDNTNGQHQGMEGPRSPRGRLHVYHSGRQGIDRSRAPPGVARTRIHSLGVSVHIFDAIETSAFPPGVRASASL